MNIEEHTREQIAFRIKSGIERGASVESIVDAVMSQVTATIVVVRQTSQGGGNASN